MIIREKHFWYLFIWTFGALVIISCTLEKRRYFKGYYIGKRTHFENPKTNSNGEKKSFYSLKQKEINPSAVYPSEDIVSVDKSNLNNHSKNNQLPKEPKIKCFFNDTCKDELVFKNGERLKVKIVEITPSVVKFYNCTLGSPYISEIPKQDLSVILPHNGHAEFIDSQSNNNSKKTDNSTGGGTKIHEEVLIGLALFAILWFVGVAYILVRYKPVRNEILSNPDKYHGKKLWDVLFYLSIAYIAIVLLYIFFIFVIFGL
jgi:hypothetical protein